MRAVALESVPSSPVVIDVDTPSPGVGELLVKVAAASLNGIDIATAAGYTQGFMEHRFPLVLGGDFAGTVEALGEGVDGFAVGDAVFGVVLKPYLGAGSLAQYVTVPAGHGVARIPAGLTVGDAGALGVAGLTAVVSLDAVALTEGETVLISGAAGGVGALAVQLAAARGAKVIATARPGTQTDFVTGLTGTEIHVVDFTADLEAQVRAIAPEGVDVVLHLAGDGAALAALLRPGGQLASATGLAQDDVKGHDVTVHTIMAAPGPKTLTSLAEQVASGALRVPVTATFPLDQATEAFAAFGAGTPGKITVSCS
ncbi:NADP-dependent oxidoreductase [Streptomyces turgidiscabies]|uniref:Oxidoreductase, zinc-binding dehydrogenase family protein n=1 Tax=Streptomyces turgidiscabies (strain Car8) TaxID=698760 RepID=L7EW02_STRT8|nr:MULTISPECIES: NADP-dependent oxidoreductase [Streptomyces]ELP62565.1 oxidoreductase, zinc-binding dehydrogenase family protein [Streptomyces turgidiscabies Car8]MDX3494860.1 NADP-dependent oxidoreductase [Streptomyces turgidiscabies]GAQ71475.1 zinc-type alcohol dehydrogenase-like protein [Streptomyces turgidiscabies]